MQKWAFLLCASIYSGSVLLGVSSYAQMSFAGPDWRHASTYPTTFWSGGQVLIPCLALFLGSMCLRKGNRSTTATSWGVGTLLLTISFLICGVSISLDPTKEAAEVVVGYLPIRTERYSLWRDECRSASVVGVFFVQIGTAAGKVQTIWAGWNASELRDGLRSFGSEKASEPTSASQNAQDAGSEHETDKVESN